MRKSDQKRHWSRVEVKEQETQVFTAGYGPRAMSGPTPSFIRPATYFILIIRFGPLAVSKWSEFNQRRHEPGGLWRRQFRRTWSYWTVMWRLFLRSPPAAPIRHLWGFGRVQKAPDEAPRQNNAQFICLYVRKHFVWWHWTRADWSPGWTTVSSLTYFESQLQDFHLTWEQLRTTAPIRRDGSRDQHCWVKFNRDKIILLLVQVFITKCFKLIQVVSELPGSQSRTVHFHEAPGRNSTGTPVLKLPM